MADTPLRLAPVERGPEGAFFLIEVLRLTFWACALAAFLGACSEAVVAMLRDEEATEDVGEGRAARSERAK